MGRILTIIQFAISAIIMAAICFATIYYTIGGHMKLIPGILVYAFCGLTIHLFYLSWIEFKTVIPNKK